MGQKIDINSRAENRPVCSWSGAWIQVRNSSLKFYFEIHVWDWSLQTLKSKLWNPNFWFQSSEAKDSLKKFNPRTLMNKLMHKLSHQRLLIKSWSPSALNQSSWWEAELKYKIEMKQIEVNRTINWPGSVDDKSIANTSKSHLENFSNLRAFKPSNLL